MHRVVGYKPNIGRDRAGHRGRHKLFHHCHIHAAHHNRNRSQARFDRVHRHVEGFMDDRRHKSVIHIFRQVIRGRIMKTKLFVILKSSAKALILLVGGWASYKLTGSWEIGSGVAIAIVPLLKMIDPTDDSIGFKAKTEE